MELAQARDRSKVLDADVSLEIGLHKFQNPLQTPSIKRVV